MFTNMSLLKAFPKDSRGRVHSRLMQLVFSLALDEIRLDNGLE